MADNYSKMTIEQLFDEYYWARKDISEYNDGQFVFSHNEEENEKALKDRYDIIYKTVTEVESRLEKDSMKTVAEGGINYVLF